jgi:hypothetical protein
MRRILAVVFVLSGLFSPLYSQNIAVGEARLSSFHDQLVAIEDASLRKTLENSIVSGLIESPEDFSAAVRRAEAIANNASPILYSAYGSRDIKALQSLITKLAAPISGLDRDAIKVIKNEKKRQGNLFEEYTGTIPRSYKDALALCEKFNPKAGTNDAAKLNKDIDAFLASIQNDPVIVHALKSTDTTIEDLKKNWFGSGLGFEHVIAGEVKGSKISGFHWWYRFYDAERRGNADVLSSVAGIGNQRIYTGSFLWDADGSGPMPQAKKPKGGFINGNSVQAILALGHIAIEAARSMGSVPGSLSFKANVNGEEFSWQLYTMGGNIRSLYPIGNSKGSVNPPGQDPIYYDHEREVLNAGR